LPDASVSGSDAPAGARHDRAAESAMRGLVGLYFFVGILLLVLGFLFTGPCRTPNGDLISDVVFVLTWPVGLYSEVYKGSQSAEDWVHRQACEVDGPLNKKPPPATPPPQPQPRP
jgi:hypothetical protein